jgi:hypothetical protein
MQKGAAEAPFPHRHLLGIEGLSPDDINQFLDLADGYVELNRHAEKKRSTLRGRTIINCFFESSTRTRTSFELAGKRLGGDVINRSVPASSMVKGETLIDTAMTLNAMHRRRDEQCPLGHMGDAWDVAYAALFLACDGAKYITRAELVVDGGLTVNCV